jgi:DNA processing protein
VARRIGSRERRDWLTLARTENVGPVTFEQLVERFGTAGDALAALPELARRGGRIQGVRLPSAAEIDAELEAGEALGARLVCGGEPDFPETLAALDAPPPLLWVRGRPELLRSLSVAVVGARVASAAGQRFARGLSAELGQAGLVVVSGLARGIDSAAHDGALPTGTIAVLGGGVDDIYPPENAGLYGRVLEAGCIVSESPPGRGATARDFPRRNRIIAGLSRAVVVVEAELRSGSLITARLAGEQGREVLAVPGSPLDPRARGTNDLIRNGAGLCEGAEDVLRALDGLRGLGEPPAEPYTAALPGVSQAGMAPESPAEAALREIVAELLSPTPVSRDEMVRAARAPAGQVFAALMELSLAGRADLLPGGLVSKA